MTADKPFDRVAAGREAIERRWAPYRAARIAQGLPPTKHAARGRTPDRLDDPVLEAYWMERAEAAGLYDDSFPRTKRRRIAQRLAQAETAAIATSTQEATQAPDDDEIVATYHSREIARLTAARASDLRRAEEHARLIVEHETALVEIMRREGRS